MELLEVRALKEFPSGLSQKLIRTQRELGWGWRGEMKHQAGEITLGVGGGDTTECYHPRARLPVRVELSLRSEGQDQSRRVDRWTAGPDGQTYRQQFG